MQAFLATRHAETVTGTDINPRALDLAAFGAALNGLHTLAWREGSLLEPVGEEMFDLITMNPPFIISPDNNYMWRDAAQPGGVGGLCELCDRGWMDWAATLGYCASPVRTQSVTPTHGWPKPNTPARASPRRWIGG